MTEGNKQLLSITVPVPLISGLVSFHTLGLTEDPY